MVPGTADACARDPVIRIEEVPLSGVPSEVLSLTRPGTTSAMKRWVSEAKLDESEGIAWLAYERQELVGWACVVDGEFSIYVRASERRRGIGTLLVEAVGDVDSLVVRPHNRIAERFFSRRGFSL